MATGKRKLGNSSLQVAPLMFGGNVFGWTADESISFALLDRFADAGLNFIDTADVYSSWVPGNRGGESETIIGKWLKRSGKRAHMVIATKVGKPMGEGKAGLGKAYIRQAVDASLQRLQTDYIDLYQSHDDDSGTPLEETLGAYAELVKEGKVRVIGASNYTAERLAAALQVSRDNGFPSYQSLQPQYNLYDRAEYERTLEPFALEHGIGVISYYSLASGFLSGKYRSEKDLGQSARGRAVKQYLDARGLRILAALDDVAATYAANPAQVALAWLMARPSITAPIASATSLAQLDDLIAATRLQLDAAAIAQLNSAGE
ncbi:aldo/keto reductase [Collimonas sp.]|jgi:aryl-alcohol dehydrogenase-like predicted oxidoreductase|uniref:aldo/keto reductase n=1 Tax=Collimonas sp. TaxID=1963772 RepID=UPI002BA9E632|nr:aldo/keto reductase [Collimonas sp.]HWX00015.1 aldo/keto reductase [Collimonas sp.]